jgi:hypothetical protein
MVKEAEENVGLARVAKVSGQERSQVADTVQPIFAGLSVA